MGRGIKGEGITAVGDTSPKVKVAGISLLVGYLMLPRR